MTQAGPILFFDGDCPFCSRWVRFLMREDGRHVFRFAPRYGRTAVQMRAILPETLPDAVILVVPRDGSFTCFAGSDAVIEVMRELDGIWRCGLLLKLVPRFLREGGYRLVARHRHHLSAGTQPVTGCRWPSHRLLP